MSGSIPRAISSGSRVRTPARCELFNEGKIDAFLALPPEPQELRARKFGHTILNTAVDRPWSQYFCCMLSASADYVETYPVATKRVLRAILKAADLCASEPELAAQLSVDRKFTDRYDYALEGLREARYDRWRDYDPEDTLRFYALRHERSRLHQVKPERNHRQGHRLALPRRAQARAEDMSRWLAGVLSLVLLSWPAQAHEAPHDQRLPTIGPAPDFTLTSQDGAPVSLRDLRGKVVAVAFIFASCTDVCPMLTDNMARVREKLGDAFGREIAFVSITVDPERDTPEVLKQYAENFDADVEGWSFLTGDPATVHEVGRDYGVIAKKKADGDVDHTLLTSLIDPNGTLRVQYIGAGFDLEEFRGDLVSLLDEAR